MHFQEDAASQDLQKLQSTIRELNASAGSEGSKIICNLCRLEFDNNKYFFRAHMMSEHSVLPNEDGHVTGQNNSDFNGPSKVSEATSEFQRVSFSNSSPSVDSEAYFDIWQKEFFSKCFLKTHKQNIHGLPVDMRSTPKKSLADEVCQIKTIVNNTISTSLVLSALDKPRNLTARNYCNICNKELCHKYFVKTHMLKRHGINLDSQPHEAARISTIGGVQCDICQKELCSKYSLKVHKQNAHGIFKERSQGKDIRGHPPFLVKEQPLQGLDLSDPSGRYFSHYPVICPVCNCRFKSIKWLEAHMISDHGNILKENFPQGISVEKPMDMRMSSDLMEPIEFIHHSISNQHSSPPPHEIQTCSGAEDGNSSENQNSSKRFKSLPTSCENSTMEEPKMKKRRKQSNPLRYQKIPVMPLFESECNPPNSPHLPMTFAWPQTPPTAGSFIMQPFLLAQPDCDGVTRNGTFVPSLVYLPVCQKVSQPMTIAFTLTPA